VLSETFLTRWQRDKVGKLPAPAWVIALKESARNRARAEGIAQVAVQGQLRQTGQLKITNPSVGPNSSVLTTAAVADHADLAERDRIDSLDLDSEPALPLPSSPLPFPACSPPLSPPLDASPPCRSPPSLPVPFRTNTADTIIVRSGASSRPPIPLPIPVDEDYDEEEQPFMPSLATIERSVACQVYFEQLYHGLLKRPAARDQRRLQLERELARLQIPDAQRRAARLAFAASESAHLRDLRTRVHQGSFVKLKAVGHGAFGVVHLVRERETGEVYAMKQLRKADMLRKGQEGHVRAERDLMTAASSTSRWIVRLAYSFQVREGERLSRMFTFIARTSTISTSSWNICPVVRSSRQASYRLLIIGTQATCSIS
jgi:hypothetical protein